jgi:RimJ/RimL family protein N-acetyltransferase
MEIEVYKTDLKEVQHFRMLFLHENNFQFIYDKCHLYGWADTYLFKVDGLPVGYGAVWGASKREDRDAIFEFFVIKPYRKFADAIFRNFHAASGALLIECQSNDMFLPPLLFEYAENINAEAILFKDHAQTNVEIPGVVFEKEIAAASNRSDERKYVMKENDEVVATGGFMLNYNMPYADIYYEVNDQHRNKGFGSLMVHELKRAAYMMGRVPAARCNVGNVASKATLLKGGFQVCGYLLTRKLKEPDLK